MILTDYFCYPKDLTWEYAKQCGVRHGVIRLPEKEDFDLTNVHHWGQVYQDFTDFGITPIILEPMPNAVHDHIKAGDDKRDESIEKVIKMFPIMEKLGITTVCFNFMAHIGWLRTKSDFPERGNAKVTAFDIRDFKQGKAMISEQALWRNYTYFLKAVLPEAEKHGIHLALHPDDPPLSKLGNVSRIFTSVTALKKGIYDICPSDFLDITFCQANIYLMCKASDEDFESVVRDFAPKIRFIHFRNTTGTVENFRETFHDNGEIDMPHIMKLYKSLRVDVPIRVDHVPTMAGETITNAGYDALGRLFAIGYLKGILETV